MTNTQFATHTNTNPTRQVALGYIVRYADGASEFHHSARGSRPWDLPTEVTAVTAMVNR